MAIREPVVAGKFYPEDKTTLLANLANYFEGLQENRSDYETVAIVSPHAGYVYSGKIAAKAFSQINPDYEYNNIFIIAPSHQCSFKGASLYNKGNYKTPLGEVEVNLALVNKLIDEYSVFTFLNEAHLYEHSLEVQLPFLQYWMKTKINIVPIIVGTQDDSILKEITEALSPFFSSNNLFVISSDFSHFPNYVNANIVDDKTANAIISNDINALQKVIKLNAKSSNLSTSACGLAGIYILMHLTQNKDLFEYRKVAYQNSGDVSDDKSRVVGYWAISVLKKEVEQNEFNLSESNKAILLDICKNSIQRNSIISEQYFDKSIPDELNEKCGVFVSVYIADKLRGCIGRFNSDKPLWKLVSIISLQSAYNDHRFNAVKKNELADLSIEISVISPFKKIDSINEIELGEHGIYIKKGQYSGTFLPQVATKTGWNKEEFIGHCSKDKAGIGWEGWRDAEIFIYTANVFRGD